MIDPHVDTLTYVVEPMGQRGCEYSGAAPLTQAVDGIGEFYVDDNLLTVTLAIHCPDTQTARYEVEPFLRAWEIQTDLTNGFGTIRFRFLSSTCHDLNPPKDSVNFGFSENIVISDSVEITIRPDRYPGPPLRDSVPVSDLVQDIHARWCQYQEGKEPLRGMANYVLTRIELAATFLTKSRSYRKDAARVFDISSRVLDEIATAAALPGIGLEARKAYGIARSRFVADAADEDEIDSVYSLADAWLLDAITKVLSHLSLRQTTNSSKQLTMADLSRLPKRPTGPSPSSQ